MKNLKTDCRFASFLLGWTLLSPHGFAQTPEPVDGSRGTGPSMDETVNFLRDIYKKQPPVQISRSEHIEGVTVEQPAPCRWRNTENDIQVFTFTLTSGRIPLRHRLRQTLLALDSSDPLSISVTPGPAPNAATVSYQADVKRAMRVTYYGPLPVHEDRPVLDLPSAGVASLDGYVLNASSSEITFIAQDENRYRIPAHLPRATVTRDGVPAEMSVAQPGDAIDYQPVNSKGKHDPTVNLKKAGEPSILGQYNDYKMPVLAEEETANRVAKALIHAMVLCHKDEKPSPF